MADGTSRERLKRLHSLLGALPLGVFVALHLWTNAYALVGRARFEAHVAWVDGLPGRAAIEIVGILLPLLLHAGIGIRLMLVRDEAVAQTGREGRDWGLVLQRATGLLALVFVAVHLGSYRWPRATGTIAIANLYDRLSAELQSMGWFAFYLAGTSAVVFHLGQGLTRLFSPAKREGAPGSRPRAVALWGGIGVVLWVLSLEILGHYYAGGSILGLLGMLPAAASAGAP
jgi:succinate dehydrogenase/fumarate reductase cytochrome b subunit (b558 family)